MKTTFILIISLFVLVAVTGCSGDSGEAGSKKLPATDSGAGGTAIQRDEEGTK